MKHREKVRGVVAASRRFQTRPEAASTSSPSRALAWEAALVALQRDTPLAPVAVARGVCEEVSIWLAAELPASWVELLVEKTAIISAHNPRFHRLLRQSGDRGRDWLWAFMRHWLAALLQRQRPACYARLPADYSRGRPLPAPLPLSCNHSAPC